MKTTTRLLAVAMLIFPSGAHAQQPGPGAGPPNPYASPMSQPNASAAPSDPSTSNTNVNNGSFNSNPTQDTSGARDSNKVGVPLVRTIKEPEKHVLAPGDQIDLFVRALPGQEKTYSIRLDGYFYYPLLGDIKAGGLTLGQLGVVMQQKLSRVLWNPKFKLGLHSVVASQITVLGEVQKPGHVDVTPDCTVLEAIQEAGGLSQTADPDTAVLTRGKINLDIPLTLSEGVAEKPMTVREGDTIYVMPGRRVTVIGEVWKPGVYALSKYRHTPLDAIRVAGGTKPDAALGRTVIQRTTLPGGQLVDLAPPVKPLPADLQEMQEGDTINVPPRQCVVFAGAPKAIPLAGGENILQVITLAGVDSKLDNIQLIRSETIKAGKPVTQKINLDKFFKKQDSAELVPINDGDIVILDVPKQGNNWFINAMQYLYPITLLRSFVP